MSEDFWAEIFAFLDIRSSNKFVRLSRVYTFRRMCLIKLVWERSEYVFLHILMKSIVKLRLSGPKHGYLKNRITLYNLLKEEYYKNILWNIWYFLSVDVYRSEQTGRKITGRHRRMRKIKQFSLYIYGFSDIS